MVVVVVVVMMIVAEGIELEMHLLRKLLQEKPPQDLTAVTEMESPIHMIPLIEMFDLGAARRRRWVADSGGSRKSVCWCHNVSIGVIVC
uniref:Secreted protein n=1 Tax=Oryza barthii TaxID=65489 RepID=A0A0D3F4M2_9ORYZ